MNYTREKEDFERVRGSFVCGLAGSSPEKMGCSDIFCCFRGKYPQFIKQSKSGLNSCYRSLIWLKNMSVWTIESQRPTSVKPVSLTETGLEIFIIDSIVFNQEWISAVYLRTAWGTLIVCIIIYNMFKWDLLLYNKLDGIALLLYTF